MRNSVGLLDALFGKRVEIELARESGGTVRCRVTAKWIRKMERLGWISRAAGTDVPPSEAAALVRTARLWAIQSNGTLCSCYPTLRDAPEGEWDFFATVASVWAAIVSMDSPTRESVAEVEAALREWHPDGPGALDDLSAFHERTGCGRDGLPLAVGLWVLWNVLGERPGPSRHGVAAVVGSALCNPFSTYWQKAA